MLCNPRTVCSFILLILMSSAVLAETETYTLLKDEAITVFSNSREYEIEVVGVSSDHDKCSFLVNGVSSILVVGDEAEIKDLELELVDALYSAEGHDKCAFKIMDLDNPSRNSNDGTDDLSSYPGFLLDDDKFNGIIVVGEKAPSSDVIAAIDIATSLATGESRKCRDAGMCAPIEVGAALLDSELARLGDENVISVGNACNNKISAQILGHPSPCTGKQKDGEGLIRLAWYSGKAHVVIAGHSDIDVRKAARVLARWNEYDLDGTEILVTGDFSSPRVKILSDDKYKIEDGKVADPEKRDLDECRNGERDSGEDGVDCGGACDRSCPEKYSCDDGVQNGQETGVDCGGLCRDCPPAKAACNGCESGENCLPFGTRIESDGARYCDVTSHFELQRQNGLACQNNYECTSNQCSDGVCGSIVEELRETRGLLKRILEWLSAVRG